MTDLQKELTPEEAEKQKKEEEQLFVKAEKHFEAVKKGEETLAKTRALLSGAIKNIHDQIGPGPFTWRGKDLRITKRKDVYSMKAVETKAPRAIGQ